MFRRVLARPTPGLLTRYRCSEAILRAKDDVEEIARPIARPVAVWIVAAIAVPVPVPIAVPVPWRISTARRIGRIGWGAGGAGAGAGAVAAAALSVSVTWLAGEAAAAHADDARGWVIVLAALLGRACVAGVGLRVAAELAIAGIAGRHADVALTNLAPTAADVARAFPAATVNAQPRRTFLRDDATGAATRPLGARRRIVRALSRHAVVASREGSVAAELAVVGIARRAATRGVVA